MVLAIKGIEISDLGIDVEFQQKRHLSVFAGFPDYDSISITIVVCLRCGAGWPGLRILCVCGTHAECKGRQY